MNTTAKEIRDLISSNEEYYSKILAAAKIESNKLCETFRDCASW